MKVSPKLELLMRSEHIGTVNGMLDAGDSPNAIKRYLDSVGFSISAPSMYKYADLYRQGLLDEAAAQMSTLPVTSDEAETIPAPDSEAAQRLRSELEALDTLIEKGCEAVRQIEPKDVTPKIMMEAIRLKNELTGGNHAFLTEYGYKSLKKLEDKKWQLVISFVMSYIQEEQRQQVQMGVAEIEESVYKGTPWHDEYLRARKGEEEVDG